MTGTGPGPAFFKNLREDSPSFLEPDGPQALFHVEHKDTK